MICLPAAALAWGAERTRRVDEGLAALPQSPTVNQWTKTYLPADR